MKHIELFNDGFDSTVQEKIQPENWPYIGHDMITGEIVYTLVPEPINYFYIESLEDNNVITLDSTTWAGYGDNRSKLQYSNDATSWTSLNEVDSITINNGERLYMRCIEGNICKDMNSVSEEEHQNVMLTPLFKTSTNCNIGGNINTVMFNYTYNNEECVLPIGGFVGMFCNLDTTTFEPLNVNYIVDASKLELPTTLAASCYTYMFWQCNSLTAAPKLPATILHSNCYAYMFANCVSLITAPELPATTLTDYCYSGMFTGCTSLTTVPELPAGTLVDNCYSDMFASCVSINHITCLATDISAAECTDRWVENVSSIGMFIKHPDMNNWPTGEHGIPEGWTVEDAVI